MKRINLNADWTVKKPFSMNDTLEAFLAPPKSVHLPHDFMIESERSADNPSGFLGGYYPLEDRTYQKEFFVPADWSNKKVFVEIEGAYMNAVVMVNNNYVGKHPYGYSNFILDLTRFLRFGEKNTLSVKIKNGIGPNARWYSGAGLYRNVNLYVTDYTYIPLDGVRISTPVVKDSLAEVLIETELVCEKDTRPVRYHVRTELFDSKGQKVGEECSPITLKGGDNDTLRQRIYLSSLDRWDIDSPILYTYKTFLLSENQVIDEAEGRFGIRSLEFNPTQGMLLNGRPIKLRGGCVHHDNGVIGACAIRAAEERKIRLMKEAGFNAVRIAHNPASRTLLDACDEQGMLVMDEIFDLWNIHKVDHDYSLYFEEWWDRDTTAMVRKDFNHPSVIMYSIGNEIAERDGSSDGFIWARKIGNLIRSLDSTRAVTSGVNNVSPFGGSMEDLIKVLAEIQLNGENFTAHSETPFEFFTDTTDEYLASLDVVGYNYLHSRYERDSQKYPNRVFVGTESMAGQIADIWKEVKRVPAAIGDFTWTAIDYIGEAGCGKIDYSKKPGKLLAGWPWYLAYCGDIDLAGNRRPQSYYREIVWGLRSAPYIAVERPEHYDDSPELSGWSWPDVIGSWSFLGFEGKPVKVQVYSAAEEVELRVNEKSLGRKATGEENHFTAVFDTVFEPGEISAIAYEGGKEIERYSLCTAGEASIISVSADRKELKAGEEDVAFVSIGFTDKNGNDCLFVHTPVNVTVSGEGTLMGCGSADPMSTENFYDAVTTPFDGRLLAVIRSGKQAGPVKVKVSAEGFESVEIELAVKE